MFEFHQTKADISIYIKLDRVAMMQKEVSEAATTEEARNERRE